MNDTKLSAHGATIAVAAGEEGWDALLGGMHYGSVVIVCYHCQRPLAITKLVGMVGWGEATAVAHRNGWEMEASDLWACPDCKDVPQPEHEASHVC